jgi:hypothetical protein
MFRHCQSCGNPVFSANSFGTEANGQINQDYCSNCYKSGHFYSKDWTSGSDLPMPENTPAVPIPPVPPLMYGGLLGESYSAGLWLH